MQKDCHVKASLPRLLCSCKPSAHASTIMHRYSKSRRLYRESPAHAGLHQCISVLMGQDVPHRYTRAGGLTEGQMQACTSAHHSDVPAHAVQIQKSRRADLREDLAQLQRAHSATTGRTAELTSRLLELSGSLRTQVGLLEGRREQLLAACTSSLPHCHSRASMPFCCTRACFSRPGPHQAGHGMCRRLGKPQPPCSTPPRPAQCRGQAAGGEPAGEQLLTPAMG